MKYIDANNLAYFYRRLVEKLDERYQFNKSKSNCRNCGAAVVYNTFCKYCGTPYGTPDEFVKEIFDKQETEE